VSRELEYLTQVRSEPKRYLGGVVQVTRDDRVHLIAPGADMTLCGIGRGTLEKPGAVFRPEDSLCRRCRVARDKAR